MPKLKPQRSYDLEENNKKHRSPATMALHRCALRYRMLPRAVRMTGSGLIFALALIGVIRCVQQNRSLKLTASSASAAIYEEVLTLRHSLDRPLSSADIEQDANHEAAYPSSVHPRLIRLPSSYTVPETPQNTVIRNGKRVFSGSMMAGYEFQLDHVTRQIGTLPLQSKRRLIPKYVPLTNFGGIRQIAPASALDKGSCRAIADWQRGHRPTCNVIHEVMSSFHSDMLAAPLTAAGSTGSSDTGSKRMGRSRHFSDAYKKPGSFLEDLEENGHARLVAGGAFRHVWMIREYDGTKRALKTLRVDSERKNFDLRSFDRHRRDAMSLEQLTSSPLVVNIFGHCSNSALFMWGEGGDLKSVFERDPDITDYTLLQIAYNASISISQAHHYDDQGRATIAHTDIKPDQFLYQDGHYKLTDFNRVRFLRWDSQKDRQCGFKVGKNAGVWRSPEEYSYEEENEKVDVFSLGNVLFFLLVRESPWEDYDANDVFKNVIKGEHPPIPDEILELRSSDKFVEYMMKAMDMCFTTDPAERPTAKEVAETIQQGVNLMKLKLEAGGHIGGGSNVKNGGSNSGEDGV